MVEPRGTGMALFTLRAADEVRAAQFASVEGDMDAEMVTIARAIIVQRTDKFDPSTYRDRYQEALRAHDQGFLLGGERGLGGLFWGSANRHRNAEAIGRQSCRRPAAWLRLPFRREDRCRACRSSSSQIEIAVKRPSCGEARSLSAESRSSEPSSSDRDRLTRSEPTTPVTALRPAS
jgi:hypothetical protein